MRYDDDKDFQARFQRVGDLVAELENIEGPEARASAKALVQLLLDLHAIGMERALEIVAKKGEWGQQAIDDHGTRSGGEQSAGSVQPPPARFRRLASPRRWRKFDRAWARRAENWNCLALTTAWFGSGSAWLATRALPPRAL
jgi:hypothetical protein